MFSEEGLMYVQQKPTNVESLLTPTQSQFSGLVFNTDFVAVSIIRAGDSMLDCFLKVCPQASVGKILIQRDEATAKPIFFYHKLPPLVGKQIILLDPMLATGGSAKAAIADLIAQGAAEDNISFFSVVSCPEGVAAIHDAFPNVQLVTAEMDAGLNEHVSHNFLFLMLTNVLFIIIFVRLILCPDWEITETVTMEHN